MNTALAAGLIFSVLLVTVLVFLLISSKKNSKAVIRELNEEHKKEVDELLKKNQDSSVIPEFAGIPDWALSHWLYPDKVLDECGWDNTIYKTDRNFIGRDASISIGMIKNGKARPGPCCLIAFCRMTAMSNGHLVLMVEDPYGSHKFDVVGLPIPPEEVSLLNQRFIIISGELSEDGKITVKRVRRTKYKKAS